VTFLGEYFVYAKEENVFVGMRKIYLFKYYALLAMHCGIFL
jgi:hypothetical protein